MLGIMEPPLHVLLKAAEEQHDIGLALYGDGGDAPVGVEVLAVTLALVEGQHADVLPRCQC